MSKTFHIMMFVCAAIAVFMGAFIDTQSMANIPPWVLSLGGGILGVMGFLSGHFGLVEKY